jgi:heterodisulfide reductase subunit C
MQMFKKRKEKGKPMNTQPSIDLSLWSANGNHMASPAVEPIEPDWQKWRTVSAASGAGIDLCWTCDTCDNGCPVNLATGRLRPQRNVRMAVFGMIDDLLSLPDSLYCLSCRRCLQGCPNKVKPYKLHQYLQNEMINRRILPYDFIVAYRRLFAEFQRVRWRTAAHCFNKSLDHMSDQTWYQWLKKPLHNALYRPITMSHGQHSRPSSKSEALVNAQACFTCSECSSCCPVICDGDVFDPQRIIRMANLGLVDELLRSPAIWLCLGCQRCSEACSQTVSGCTVIQKLQQQAIKNGFIDTALPDRLLAADRIIYPKFLDEIDTLMGLYRFKRQ